MRRSQLIFIVGLIFLPGATWGRGWTFDPSSLGKGVDISALNEGRQLAGIYPVDILLNGELVDSRDVVFHQGKGVEGDASLQPCLPVKDLSQYGIKVDEYPALVGGRTGSSDDEDAKGQCADLSVIPQATVAFDFYNQQLKLSVPQIAIRPKLRGIAPSESWDDGVPALLLDYRANINRTENNDQYGGNNQSSSYVQLNPGANLGAWRLRNQTNWQKTSDNSGKWQTVQTYAERGLYGIKSRVTLGEHFTPSDVFDRVPFRGAMLSSDDLMVPWSQREYAPVVRGIARTQARVVVEQNGYTIYSEMVAPGPFALTNLSVPNGGGDLQITVQEADGSLQVFTVPYQTPAIALHEGYMKYNMMLGQYRPSYGGANKALVGQISGMYGLPWNLTTYGGLQGAEHYQAASLGMGVSLGGWGSLSLDATESRGRQQNCNIAKGQVGRARYSKSFDGTNTTFSLASYRYASSGYSTLPDVLDTYRSDNGWNYSDTEKRKSSTSLMVSQSVGDWGYFNVSGTRDNYWNQSRHNDQLSVSYGISVAKVNLNLSWSQNKQISEANNHWTDRMTSVSVNVPLDRWLGNSTYATYQMTSPSGRPDVQEVGLIGQSYDRQLSWNVGQSHSSAGQGREPDSSRVDATWFGRYGQLGGNYRYSPYMRQMGARIAGGVVAHSHGLTVGQPLSETVVLVEAPGASGVPVNGWGGISTDFRGYALGPYVTPYQENMVSLDPTRLPPDAEITQTDVRVIPSQGAVIPAKFRTRIGSRAVITLMRPDNSVVPFGALAVLNGEGVGAGVVGDGGQVYLTGLPHDGELTVRWSETQQCRVSYRLPETKDETGMYTLKSICH
ncbi:TPA: fimbria/pilus outer membrane usher protein [Raoultella planticola]|nr:fimbria/pilus outer membrane usher protein [Raoultella planticola]